MWLAHVQAVMFNGKMNVANKGNARYYRIVEHGGTDPSDML